MNEVVEQNIKEIMTLPGLKKVKDEVKSLVAYLETAAERKNQGLVNLQIFQIILYFLEIQVQVKRQLLEF